MKTGKPILGIALLFFLPQSAYSISKPLEITRGIFTMLTKSNEFLAKARNVLKGSSTTTEEIMVIIESMKKTLAKTARTPDEKQQLLKTLLVQYIELITKTMTMSCKEYDYFDQLGKEMIISFDKTLPGQISKRGTSAKQIAAALAILQQQIKKTMLEVE